MWETWVQSLGWEDLLEKGKATHFSILAWRTPWTVQFTWLQRVGLDSATFTFREPDRYEVLKKFRESVTGLSTSPVLFSSFHTQLYCI